MGNRIEAAVAEEYVHETGAEIANFGTMIHPVHPWMLATPDACVRGTRRLLEIKCVGWRSAMHWGTGPEDIPNYYLPQVQWQLEVCDADECHVAAWIGGSDFRIYTIRRDREMAEMLMNIGRQFWFEYVLPGVPPPADGTDGARRMLEKLYPRNTKPLKRATPEIEALAASLKATREQLETVETAKASLENRIIEAIGDADGIASDGWKATFKAAKTGKRSFRFTTKENAA
jgi:predicted phage-related endonuclease